MGGCASERRQGIAHLSALRREELQQATLPATGEVDPWWMGGVLQLVRRRTLKP